MIWIVMIGIVCAGAYMLACGGGNKSKTENLGYGPRTGGWS
jgi:hypothetical protein